MGRIPLCVFDRQGRLRGPLEVERVELSDAQWKSRLAPEQYRILRQHGTERAFCGTLLDNKKHGVYACAGCGLPLFSSNAKFNSGTGWPSFFRPIALENVAERTDRSYGMVRVEILCARCDGHLGHVFDDGPPPTGLRFCLNSESLVFTDESELASLADPAADEVLAQSGAHADDKASEAIPSNSAIAIFAGGCFWCTEAAFEDLAGVSDVTSGYAGGAPETANYEAVCSGRTGHAEAIRVTYDPSRITYDQLLDVFFDAHDPTQLNRQGNDMGTQYRSAIFFATDAERAAAQAKIDKLNAAGKFRQPIVTKLEPLVEFFAAEAYHQDYARHHPEQPYIQFHALAKACKVREKHSELFDDGSPRPRS